jgi:hypothetical protein
MPRLSPKRSDSVNLTTLDTLHVSIHRDHFVVGRDRERPEDEVTYVATYTERNLEFPYEDMLDAEP